MRSCAAIPSRCRLITFLALLGVASGLALSFVLPLPTNSRCPAPSPVAPTHLSMVADSNASDQAASSKRDPFRRPDRGKLLVLGGTGFLGNSVAARAVLDGYSVTSLSRRGLPPSLADGRATVRERGARRLRRGGRGGGGRGERRQPAHRPLAPLSPPASGEGEGRCVCRPACRVCPVRRPLP